jgi:hypothetical protein
MIGTADERAHMLEQELKLAHNKLHIALEQRDELVERVHPRLSAAWRDGYIRGSRNTALICAVLALLALLVL